MNSKYADASARLALAREIASEAMVLLKNEGGLLPLAPGKTVAVLGQTQLDPIIGGGGSGASFSPNALRLREELVRAGLVAEPAMDGFYQELDAKRKAEGVSNVPDYASFEGLVTSGLIYEIFGKYEPPTPEELPEPDLWEAARATDTAICIIGRITGGEEGDRHLEGDYTLTATERELIQTACAHFPRVAVVLNVNGMVDMSWMEDFPQIQAAIFMGTAGEQAAGALADLITGKATPSGKLSQTAARCYEDYPTARNMTYTRDDPALLRAYESYGLSAEENGSKGFAASPVTAYEEDIYVGYRYFDSFQKPVLYPFGFGLSYAEFSIQPEEMKLVDGTFTARVRVTNTSAQYAGKEAVQLYVHAPFGQLKKPWQELKAIAKTPLLQPGESCKVELAFPLREMASFDEAGMRYVMEAGTYTVLIGNSSKNTAPAARLILPEEITTRTVTAELGFAPANQGKIQLLEPEGELPVAEGENLPLFTVAAAQVDTTWPVRREYDFQAPAVPSTLEDVRSGKVTVEQFVAQMSLRELAVLCNGYGPGLPFGGLGMGKDLPSTIQDEDGREIGTNSNPHANPGYCNPGIEKYGIPSKIYRDGPASVGKTAWPTGMMLACTFNPALAYEFGSACGCEAEVQHIDSWLAPGLNLIRNPLEGRAFEYFSEDPYLCGLFGTRIAKGAMENNNVTVCPKHFALNEQETYRRGSQKKNIDAVDSIVSARAARELYLRPFEAVVTQARPWTLMSSFNKVNGTFAAGNHALCTEVLRGEWAFDGVVVTDWGDMDFVVDGADAVRAGNDVIMPGGPPVIAQVLQGYEEGRVSMDELRLAVCHLINFLIH